MLVLGPVVILLLLQRQVVGQEEAVRSVANALKRARLGLKDPKRPIATLMFCGPTGVGKTQLTKVIGVSAFYQILPKRLCMQHHMPFQCMLSVNCKLTCCRQVFLCIVVLLTCLCCGIRLHLLHAG